MSVTTPAPPPLPAELEQLLRRLKLPYVRRSAPEVLATATAQRWEPAEVLRVLFQEEAAGRDRATIASRRRASGLPAGKTFEAWEESAAAIPKPTQRALGTLEWIDRAEALCVCGPSGTGKSHFVEALGHLAIDRGKTVVWHTLESLEGLVRSHRADDTVTKARLRVNGHRFLPDYGHRFSPPAAMFSPHGRPLVLPITWGAAVVAEPSA